MRYVRMTLELAIEGVVIGLTTASVIALASVAIEVRTSPRLESHTVKGFPASNVSRVLAD